MVAADTDNAPMQEPRPCVVGDEPDGHVAAAPRFTNADDVPSDGVHIVGLGVVSGATHDAEGMLRERKSATRHGCLYITYSVQMEGMLIRRPTRNETTG